MTKTKKIMRQTTTTCSPMTWAEFITIMAAQLRYTSRTARYFFRQEASKVLWWAVDKAKAVKAIPAKYMAFLDDGDGDIMEMTARQIITGSLIAMLVAVLLCIEF